MLLHIVRATLFVEALLFGIAPALAASENPGDPLLDKMTGRWTITGTIEGKKVKHDFKGEWVVQYKYLRFREVSDTDGANGWPEYEAIVFVGFDQPNNRYVCFWFDNTGVAGPNSGGTAQRTGDSLPFVFKSANGEFHNTMTYDAKSDSWTWIMENVKTGAAAEPFAKLVLTRNRHRH